MKPLSYWKEKLIDIQVMLQTPKSPNLTHELQMAMKFVNRKIEIIESIKGIR